MKIKNNTKLSESQIKNLNTVLHFLLFLLSLAFESFSNVVLTKPWKSPKAEAIPNITTKPKPAIIVTIQVPVPRFSGTANNGIDIKKSITNKITLESLYMVEKFYVFSIGAIVNPLLISC